MFEFLYATKVDNDKLVQMIENNMDKYDMNITFNKNGSVEVFIGSNKENLTDALKEWKNGK